ncbi:MAG TPA: hypothetical protein VFO20_00730, partial [Propionibacteriaceae bacterium]|nr:hypothetical protein [Propionibacteriaceae bacterium]
LLKQVVENLGNSQDQRDVSLAFEDLKLCAGDVLTEPYRMLGPDVAIVRAVPPPDQPPIVTNSPRPRWLKNGLGVSGGIGNDCLATRLQPCRREAASGAGVGDARRRAV